MRLISSLIVLAGMVCPSFAGDYDSVIKTARETWPDRRTVVVVCNKDASSMALMDLGSATEKVISLLVGDISHAKDIEKTIASATRKPRNEIFVLLVSDDPITGEGTHAGRVLISRMLGRGVPVVGITPGSIKDGAVFAQGAGTGDKVLTNPEAAKRLGVTLPETPVAAK